MNLKQQIDADIKSAMLAGEKTLVTTLRGLKAAILNEEVASGTRETGLSDDKVVVLLQKEAKKRQESADLYAQGGNADKQQAELAEKEVIAQYLPQQLGEDEIKALVEEAVASAGATGMQQMGHVIGAVKARAGASADGAIIARLVKEKLAQ